MEIRIKGMHCNACETLIKDILEEEGIAVISISHTEGKADIEQKNVPSARIKALLAAEGYEVEE